MTREHSLSWAERDESIAGTSPVREDLFSFDLVREDLRRRTTGWYAVLDACDEPRVPLLVKQLGERAVSLYRGYAELDYADIAPYLVQLDVSLLDWIVDELGADPWGILARSESALPAVRRHFRQFLLVRGPEHKQLYFRFYDPRVLRVFLRTTSVDRRRQFFGPVNSFYLMDEDQQWCRLSLGESGGGIGTGRLPLEFSDVDLTNIAQQRRNHFRQRVAEHLSKLLTERQRTVPVSILERQIDEGLRRARFYQLGRECDVARYLEVICVLLDEFPTRADPLPMQNVLLDRRITIEERLQQLVAWAVKRRRQA